MKIQPETLTQSTRISPSADYPTARIIQPARLIQRDGAIRSEGVPLREVYGLLYRGPYIGGRDARHRIAFQLGAGINIPEV